MVINTRNLGQLYDYINKNKELVVIPYKMLALRNKNLINEINTNTVYQNIQLLTKMPIEDFNILELLGKGSFGSVVKVKRKADGQIYAMKQIKLQKLNQKDKKNALNQIRILASMNHPNIVSYREAFYDQETQNLCIVMEYANQGDLSNKIKIHLNNKKARIMQQSIWKVAYELLQGLNKLHQSNIIHRDVKPANIFFHNGCAKIGDLNIAKHLKDPFTITQTGTPYYASPQVWKEAHYDYKTDIWSLGCVLYEMAALRPPFTAGSSSQLFKKIKSRKLENIPDIYSKQLKQFIDKMLSVDQEQRPTSKQLLSHQKMLEMKRHDELSQVNQKLMNTIKFPSNLHLLNDKLPKAQYEVDQRPKTSKNIDYSQTIQKQNNRIPPLKFRSQKNIYDKYTKYTNKEKKVIRLNQHGSTEL